MWSQTKKKVAKPRATPLQSNNEELLSDNEPIPDLSVPRAVSDYCLVKFVTEKN